MSEKVIVEFVGTTAKKKEAVERTAEKYRKKGYKVIVISDCEENLPQELSEANYKDINLWMLFEIQKELIRIRNLDAKIILLTRGLEQMKLDFWKLLSEKKISQEEYDLFKRLILRDLKSDFIIEADCMDDETESKITEKIPWL